MKRAAAFLLFLLGCQRPAATPEVVGIGHHSPPAHDPAEAPSVKTARPSIALLEKPTGGDDDVLSWDFDVQGLPAMDPSTGAIIVADLSHGNIASCLSLSIRWLRPGQKEPLRTLTVLADEDASRVLYDLAATPEAAIETAKLHQSVRERVKEANSILASAALRPTIPCTLQAHEGGTLCAHPQRLTCGPLVAELVSDGAALTWHLAAKGSTTNMGWSRAPMQIGDGPPKEMVTCMEQAHFDPATMSLAARIEQSCKGGGSDACFLQEEWRAITIR